MFTKVETPRFVSCVTNECTYGNVREYIWDKEKIFVAEDLSDDILMLQNVFEGKIISPFIYPLIFDNKTDEKGVLLRSLEFYRQVVNDKRLYENLSLADKIIFSIGLRDLFVASCRSLLTEEEIDLFRKAVEVIDPNEQDAVSKTIDNLTVTPYPTARNKTPKFIEVGSRSTLDECFIRNELNLMLVFVDPCELSFHNFENIINLNSLFDTLTAENFTISNILKHGKDDIYTFDMKDKEGVLISLDKYGLYAPPLNKSTRGGQRFIFSSDKLSQVLMSCIKRDVKENRIINKLEFVNYVFRYNKFKPGDKRFANHYDTPYYDPVQKHYSRYTLLLYLSPGLGDPILNINQGKVKIHRIDTSKVEIKGIIFDQKYEHERKPYLDNDKIFLRSELVYQAPVGHLDFDNEISKKFNIACYMTKQSAFHSELEKYASECFDHTAEARLNLAKSEKIKDVLLYKKYKNVSFITNGYDYWFHKSSVTLKEAGVMVLLDYFNCKSDSQDYFNKLTYSEIINIDTDKGSEGIFQYLEDKLKESPTTQQDKLSKESVDEEKYFEETKNEEQKGDFEEEDDDESDNEDEEEEKNAEDEENTIKKASNKETIKKRNKSFVELLQSAENIDLEKEKRFVQGVNLSQKYQMCCYQHFRDFTPFKSSEVVRHYYATRLREKKIIKNLLKDYFTIYIADKKLVINESNIIVAEKAIIFNDKIPKINFAGCWNDDGFFCGDYIIKQQIDLKVYGNIPPIPYVSSEGG